MTGKEKIHNFLFPGPGSTKSKGHILLLVLMHLLAWSLFIWVPLLFYPIRFEGDSVWRRELVSKILPVALFYINYYFFLPRYFERRKYRSYFLWLSLSLVLIISSDILIRSHITRSFPRNVRFEISNRAPRPEDPGFNSPFTAPRNGAPFQPVRFEEKRIGGIPTSAIFFSINRSLSACLFLLLLGGMIRLAYSFIKNQHEKKSLENANLNAEVNFLKSQINPHFLFNTLNSIYSQANSRSEQTAFSVLKLSELLRYMLYDSGEEKVSLEKDIHYIHNYIDLQRIRLSSKVVVDFSVTGNAAGKRIAPLLLITFIENAFKHGISYSQASAIRIHIRIFEETLTLSVVNPVTEKDSFAPGGLGLRNVKRRLELLYHDQYQLDIRHQDNLYIVDLKLVLNHA